MLLRRGLEIPRSTDAFVREALGQDPPLRLDGREAELSREVSLLVSRDVRRCRAVAVVQWGSIRVHCTVSGSIVRPYPDRSTQGLVSFQGMDGTLHRILEKVLKSSEAVDTESLCIIAGEKVWSIVCSIRLLDETGGNVLDAIVLAALAGFQAFRKPDVEVTREGSSYNIRVFHEDEREPLPLALHFVPLAVSVGVMRPTLTSEHVLIVDPDQEELEAADASLLVLVNSHQEICFVHKSGGMPIPRQVFLQASHVAVQASHRLHSLLRDALLKLENDCMLERNKRLEILPSLRAEELTKVVNSDD